MNNSRNLENSSSLTKYLAERRNFSLWQLRETEVSSSTENDLSDWLNEKPLVNHDFRACFASKQIKAFGQSGKEWISPVGGVWVSVAMPFYGNIREPQLLGLACALSLSERLNYKKINVKIKWPNDLIVSGKKLAGILPKIVSRGNKILFSRIGLGLNVLNEAPCNGISLYQILGSSNCMKNFWAAEVLLSLEKANQLMSTPSFICKGVENRLWAQEYIEPSSGLSWNIEGLSSDGSLKISKGSKIKLIRRW